MLSQRVALLVQALSGTLTPGQRSSAQQRLRRSISLMAGSHAALVNGSPAIPRVEGPTGRRRLTASTTTVKESLAHARAVANRPTVTGADPDVRYVRAAAQSALLQTLKNVAD